MSMDTILDNNIVTPVTTPEQAIEQFVGEQFIEWLMETIVASMRSWPEISAINSALPKVERIRKFMIQRFIAAEAFVGGRDGEPGFLGFAIANLSESDDPQAESALEILGKKQSDEQALGVHKEMWGKLLLALGATADEIEKSEPKEWTRNYIAELSDIYSNGEWQEVAGAFAAHERATPVEYTAILNMIRTQTQLSESDLEVLTFHSAVDIKYMVETGHILEKIVFDLETKQMVWQGVQRELQIRKDFLSGLVKHLEN